MNPEVPSHPSQAYLEAVALSIYNQSAIRSRVDSIKAISEAIDPAACLKMAKMAIVAVQAANAAGEP